MASRLPVALIGAGLIGRAHAQFAATHPDVTIAGVADPSPDAKAWAEGLGLRWFAQPQDLLDSVNARAAIVATPNALHETAALACAQRRLPTLVEKPIAHTLESGAAIVRAFDDAKVPLLVGHQRRHSPIARAAKRQIDDGVLGTPVSANLMACWLKPDPYFDVAWRRTAGGGPVLINLIHDVDLLRFFLGDVAQVQAVTSNARRGFDVEDTAAVIMRLKNGALATLVTTDSAVAPWNWDLTAGEAAHYPRQNVDAYFLSGTEGSLTLPRLEVWRYREQRGWHEPLSSEVTAPHASSPYLEQLRHLRAVAEGHETPVCSGADGLATLRATLAVHEAAARRSPVDLD